MAIQQMLVDREDQESHAILAPMVAEQIRTLARVLNRAECDRDGVSLRIRFCGLCDNVLSKREYRALRNEYRDELFRTVTSWVETGIQVGFQIDVEGLSDRSSLGNQLGPCRTLLRSCQAVSRNLRPSISKAPSFPSSRRC